MALPINSYDINERIFAMNINLYYAPQENTILEGAQKKDLTELKRGKENMKIKYFLVMTMILSFLFLSHIVAAKGKDDLSLFFTEEQVKASFKSDLLTTTQIKTIVNNMDIMLDNSGKLKDVRNGIEEIMESIKSDKTKLLSTMLAQNIFLWTITLFKN